ncbi:MAG: hypothetical protein WBF53_09910 [Litorimonas sp.]
MNLKTVAAISALLSIAIAAPAFASPDVYVVNFRKSGDVKSQQLDSQLPSALAMAGVNAEEVVIDTSTAAKWEKGAHEAFDRDIVPVFNKWVGLPGFAAVVDADTKRVIGCVTPEIPTDAMARELKKMASAARGEAFSSRASTSTATRCPAAFNVDPGF